MNTKATSIVAPVVWVYAVVSAVWIISSDWLTSHMTGASSFLTDLHILKGLAFVAVTSLLLHILLRSKLKAREADEARLRVLFEYAPDGYYLLDDQGVFLELNKSAEAIIGCPRREYIGQNFQELGILSEDDLKKAVTSFKANLEGLPWGPMELLLNRKDGSRVPIEIRTYPVKFGDKFQILGIARDISARLVAQQALAESERKYRQLVDHSADGIFIVDNDTRFLFVNPAGCAVLNSTLEQALKLRSEDTYLGADKPLLARRLEEARKGGPVRYDRMLLRPDGSQVEVEICLTCLGNDKFQGIVRDVTDRRRAERELRSSEERLKLVLQASNDGFWDWDIARDVVFYSPRALELFGFPPENYPKDVAGWEHCIHSDDLPKVKMHLDEHMQGKRNKFEIEYRLVLQNGVIRYVFDRGNICARDEQGRPSRMLGMVTDITERRLREQELFRANRALAVTTRCNEVVIRAASEAKMLEQICSVIAVVGGYQLVWVGYAEHDNEKQVRPAAFAGPATGYLDHLRISWADNELGQGPAGRCIRTGQPVLIHRSAEQPCLSPWREELLRFGLNSCAVFPLQIDEQTVGVLYIYSIETEAFDDEETKLLNELAADVAFGIQTLRARNQQSLAAAELKQSQMRQRAILDNIPDMAWVKDRGSNYITANSAYAASQKRTADDFIGRNDFEFYPRGLAERYRADDQEVISTRQRKRIEEPYVDAQGRTTWIETIKTPIMNDSGEVVGTAGIARDITERRKTEEQLLLQGAALEAAANAIVITDRQGIIRWVNEAFSKITGYCQEEVVGHNPRVLKSGIVDKTVYTDLWKTVLSGNVWSGELINRRKDGTLYYEEQTITPVRGPLGEITHFIGIKQDVTDRRNADAKIHEQAQLLDLAHDAILVENLDHTIQYWNQGAERIYGWGAKEAVGANSVQLFYRNGEEKGLARQTLFAQGHWAGELKQINRQGKELVVNGHWTLMKNNKGEPVSILVINSDITEKKSLEAQFLQAQRMESIGTLASGVAHDLNNILAPILMSAQILKMDQLSPETEKIVDTVEFSAQRGADVVRQLLTFARGMKGDHVQVQLRHLVKDLVKVTSETFPPNIRITSNIPGNLWVIMGDPTQMHQLLLNLCVNARDAMPEGGCLSIEAENLSMDESYASMMPEAKPGPYAVLTVSDTGMGIRPEIISRIFDPFFTTKEPGKGTGLGLSTVLGIAKAHGGFLRVSSSVGQGTTFRIFLPATQQPAVEVQTKKPVDLPQGNGELILLVDDEKNVREVCKSILMRNGYQVLVASDGTEALALFAQMPQKIHLVLTDIIMPFMDGVALVRALRRFSVNQRIVVASGLGSGGSNEQRVQDLKNLGVTQFMSKPYDSEKLLNTIHEVLTTP